MKKNNPKYLVIDAEKINKNFPHDYYSDNPNIVSLDTFFKYNAIPKKYHKIILEYNPQKNQKKPSAEEFTTGLKLYYNHLTKIFNTGPIPRKTNQSKFYNEIFFENNSQEITYEEALSFYKELKKSNLLEKYICTLAEAFDYYYNIPLVLSCYEETQNRHKALKLYNKKIK